MQRFPFITSFQSLALLRILLSLYMIIHGCFRLYHGTVSGFGEFLNSYGFMIGVPIAWGITLFEIAGGAMMALGYFVRYISAIWMMELVVGIILVHAANGWFVVGGGTGGMEYSILLIVSLVVIAATNKER